MDVLLLGFGMLLILLVVDDIWLLLACLGNGIGLLSGDVAVNNSSKSFPCCKDDDIIEAEDCGVTDDDDRKEVALMDVLDRV